MKQTKHTPGPWQVQTFRTRAGHFICTSPAGPDIAVVKGNNLESEANARLIAAAPETAAERDRLKEINVRLLAILKQVVADYKEFAEIYLTNG